MDRRYMDMDRRIIIVTFAAFLSLPCIEMLGIETDSDTFQFDDWAKTLDLSINTKEVLRSEELTTERTLSLLNPGDILSLNLPLGQRKLIESGIAEIKRKAAGGGSSSNNAEMLGTVTDSEREDQRAKSRSDPSTSPLCWEMDEHTMLDVSGKKLTGVWIDHCEFCCLNKPGCVAINYGADSKVCYMLSEDHRDDNTRIYKENMYYAYLDTCNAPDTGYMNWLNEKKWCIAGAVLGGGAAAFAAPYLLPGIIVAQVGVVPAGLGAGTLAARLIALRCSAGDGVFADASMVPKECTIETCPCV